MASLSEQLKPMIDDLELPGKMGMGVSLNAIACKNYAKVMNHMVRMIEIHESNEYRRKQHNMIWTSLIGVVVFFYAMGSMFNG
jgi:hypothetical protein